MRYSIASLMNFNMFGIPHTGAEVCGFSACNNTGGHVCYSEAEQQELCGRWMQLATFYPFARQAFDNMTSLEPYNLDAEFKTMATASI